MPLARVVVLAAIAVLIAGCGASAASQPASTPASAASGDDQGQATVPPATQDDGATASTGAGPIGGDIGDSSKGSVHAEVTGGLTSTIDIPFGAPAARFLVDGPNSAYLPYTDPVSGTLFMTITDGQLAIQYAGPNDVALASGGTPCELKLDSLDASGAKGSFTCKALMLIQGGNVGSADMTGTFEGHP